MLSFDPMAGIAATLYFLGTFLYYLHIRVIFVLNEMEDMMDQTKSMISAILWPLHTVYHLLSFLFPAVFLGGDDDQ